MSCWLLTLQVLYRESCCCWKKLRGVNCQLRDLALAFCRGTWHVNKYPWNTPSLAGQVLSLRFMTFFTTYWPRTGWERSYGISLCYEIYPEEATNLSEIWETQMRTTSKNHRQAQPDASPFRPKSSSPHSSFSSGFVALRRSLVNTTFLKCGFLVSSFVTTSFNRIHINAMNSYEAVILEARHELLQSLERLRSCRSCRIIGH